MNDRGLPSNLLNQRGFDPSPWSGKLEEEFFRVCLEAKRWILVPSPSMAAGKCNYRLRSQLGIKEGVSRRGGC